MISFLQFSEATRNKIDKKSKEVSVSGHKTYEHPSDFKKDSHKIGDIHGLELHRADHTGGSSTHFTWHPKDKKIHHVLHAVETHKTESGGTRLKYLSAHGRDESHVRMGDVYKHLMKHHKTEFIGTGHSKGAEKMWHKFHDDKDIEIHGHHPDTGETVKLHKDDKKYGDLKSTDKHERRIAKMHLIAKKKDE